MLKVYFCQQLNKVLLLGEIYGSHSLFAERIITDIAAEKRKNKVCYSVLTRNIKTALKNDKNDDAKTVADVIKPLWEEVFKYKAKIALLSIIIKKRYIAQKVKL